MGTGAPVGGRWRGSYGLAVAIALLGLVPNVALQTGFLPVSPLVAGDLGAAPVRVQVAEGVASAAYAVGAVVGAQLAQRVDQRRLFLGYEVVFVLASVVTAAAPGLGEFAAGRTVQGLAAGAMLISSLPPLIARFPASRLPITVVIVNVGIFGASTIGPILGGRAADAGTWRVLFAAGAVLGVLGWLAALVGYASTEPADPEGRVDTPALVLTVVATVSMFVGTSLLAGRGARSPAFWVPLLLGAAALVALLVVEVRREDSLIPARALSTQLPVTGILVASVGGAVFVAAVGLLQQTLSGAGASPGEIAALCWPMPVGVLAAAVVFGLVLRTRFVPVLVDVGLALLVAACLLLVVGGTSPSHGLVLLVGLLLGAGAGATVSPGLFLTGWALPASSLGSAFALVQLLRSTATYAVGPVVLYVATASGLMSALVATTALAAAGLVAAVLLPALSGARLRVPDIEGWLEGGRALPSPRTAVHARPGSDDDAEPLVPRPLRRR